MVNPSEAKILIERVHLRYLHKLGFLPAEVVLNEESESFPDLVNPAKTFFFELKSRNYPHNLPGKKNYASQYGWWDLDADQIRRHEEEAKRHEMENAWIFVRGHSNRPLSSYSQISENIILQREIFIVPKGVHNLVNKAGNFHYIGLARLKRTYEFSLRCLNRTQLYVEKGLESKLTDLF